MKHFEEQVAGTCPKNSTWFEFVGLVVGTTVGCIDLEAKMVSSQDGTCLRDLLQGLVAVTSPLMCGNLNWPAQLCPRVEGSTICEQDLICLGLYQPELY